MEGVKKEYTFKMIKMFENKDETVKETKLTINEKITIG